jgi:DNA-binding transcriptional ArsR family regulator
MSFEEDTYTTIFKAMQHPIRRRILRMISEKPSTYTEIQRDLNIDNGLLNYHLEALNSLITKNGEEKYTLSDFGRATAGLIKGVEEPNKDTKVTSTPTIVKVIAGILAVALIASGVGFIELNNRYLDLSGRYGAQSVENTYLKSTLVQAQTSESRLNATLTVLEKNPLVKASTMIIDRFGVDYFTKYFHDPEVFATQSEPNSASVVYKYWIEADGYTEDRNITFYFDQSGSGFVWGLPPIDNIQPFKVSMADAKQLALQAGLPDSPYGLEARILGDFEGDVRPTPLWVGRYVWHIISLIDPPWARTRIYKQALVDPNSGQVYAIRMGGTGITESQVDTAEKAAAQGIEGYVKLEYPELPTQIQIVKGGNLTFAIRASLISYKASLGEVKLMVDPNYVVPYTIQANAVDQLRSLLSYEPNGVLTLKTGASMNITVMVRAPSDTDIEFLFPRWALDSLGIGAEGTLVLSDLEA